MEKEKICVNGSLHVSFPKCPRQSFAVGIAGFILPYLISPLFPLKDVYTFFTGLFSKEKAMWQTYVAWEALLALWPFPERMQSHRG